VDNWLGMIGPRNMTASQIAYWDHVLSATVQTDRWKEEIEKNDWTANYMDSKGARVFLAAQYKELRATLSALGLAK